MAASSTGADTMSETTITTRRDQRRQGPLNDDWVPLRPKCTWRGARSWRTDTLSPISARDVSTATNSAFGYRHSVNYLGLPDIVDPSVISLNGISASMAVTTFFLWATGQSRAETLDHRLFSPLSGDALSVKVPRCEHCRISGESGIVKPPSSQATHHRCCRSSARGSLIGQGAVIGLVRRLP
jgi:hypothetical protein